MSIEQRGKGWTVRYREGRRARSRAFDRKRDAELFEADVRRRKQLGSIAGLTGGRDTLSTFVSESWAPLKMPHLSERTRDHYRWLYDGLIEPWLGELRLDELTFEVIGRWQVDALRAGKGRGSVAKAFELLSGILEVAMRNDRILRNTARLVTKIKVPKREVPPMPAPLIVERMMAFARQSGMTPEHGARDALIISILAYSGLRPAEMRGLQWGDLRGSTLFIQRSVTKAGCSPTKTSAQRNVKILSALKDDLFEQCPADARDDMHVIRSDEGDVFSYSAYESWVRRVFHRCRERVGAETLRPYDLRHAFSSLLLHEGRSVIYVAGQLGHDPRLTLTTYGHVIDELEDSPQLPANDAIARARADLRGVQNVYGEPDSDAGQETENDAAPLTVGVESEAAEGTRTLDLLHGKQTL